MFNLLGLSTVASSLFAKATVVGHLTPLAKMRIRWASGAKTYDSAEDMARDMEERGYEVGLTGEGFRDRSEGEDKRPGRMATGDSKQDREDGSGCGPFKEGNESGSLA
ncbi:unnamed protein product [Pleuronectes platessa]|uniref:Uncharacterized protein n=1 Tax=Pleuronectes platessa TaxID=8262 RepID=A0A9N7Z3J0_PLEPL|nr:unnamed protein product [Pleuronectes platessa]